MYRDVQVSPNGKYVLVSFVKPPFSYLVPYYRFPTETHVYDLNANRIKIISDSPLQEVLPKGFMAVSREKGVYRGVKTRRPQFILFKHLIKEILKLRLISETLFINGKRLLKLYQNS